MYLAGFGPVNEGTPMNLYCFSGGGLGRIVERRPSLRDFELPALPSGLVVVDPACAPEDVGAPAFAVLPALATAPLAPVVALGLPLVELGLALSGLRWLAAIFGLRSGLAVFLDEPLRTFFECALPCLED